MPKSKKRPKAAAKKRAERRTVALFGNARNLYGPEITHSTAPPGYDEMPDMEPPPDELLDNSQCELVGACEGCQAAENLIQAVACFQDGYGGWRAACATVCSRCDGTSFMHLDHLDLDEAIRRHAGHVAK